MPIPNGDIVTKQHGSITPVAQNVAHSKMAISNSYTSNYTDSSDSNSWALGSINFLGLVS